MEQNLENWLLKEAEEVSTSNSKERLEILKIEENKLYDLTVDFSKPFNKWVDPQTATVKKIIPVVHEGKQKVWFLNVKNPVYSEIIHLGLKGLFRFKITRTGKFKNTKYTLMGE